MQRVNNEKLADAVINETTVASAGSNTAKYHCTKLVQMFLLYSVTTA